MICDEVYQNIICNGQRTKPLSDIVGDVPLTSFASQLQGFRVTLLEIDEAKFTMIFKTMADSIARYLASS